jgi:CBS domain-containing protein/gamma-glutamyl:cysteine ligase YbdK (ATP-grasp superfamily)
MGAKGVRIAANQQELNQFTRHLLKDIQALEKMLENDWFETEQMHIGAEQEICLVDENNKPASKSMEILEKLKHPNFTTELAQFNLEANLDPLPFAGECFSKLEAQIHQLMALLKDTAKEFDVKCLLTGILPTIRRFDIEMENLTPLDRYYALIEAINRLRGDVYELKIEGIDELNIKQETALIEACNTSFQVHLQVRPNEFVSKYNIAQVIAAPVLAVSSNSPMLFGKRLWNETRIALFQQSVDTRATGEHLRYTSPRVTFGNRWLKDSILDLYKEDIMRFRVLLTTDVEEDVMQCIEQNITPKLKALNIHNSTVYRWNRPCYGISPNGKPHLRIENRILPAGPTVVDEIANAAFWIGLMNGFEEAYPEVTNQFDFDETKANFIRSARVGLSAKFVWAKGKVIGDTDLIQKELIPIARQGLEKANIRKEDIDRYLGIIDDRTRSGMTGSKWILNSYAKLIKETTKEEAANALVSSIMVNQERSEPVHLWRLADIHDNHHWEPYSLLVEEFMTTDIFTVNIGEIPEFAADMMDWQNIRYIPIENEQGELVGLVTSRRLLRYFSNLYKNDFKDGKVVKDLMIEKPITIGPEATVIEAMEIMNRHQVTCLPVVTKNKLIGIITEGNFLDITSSLFKRLAAKKEKDHPKNTPKDRIR